MIWTVNSSGPKCVGLNPLWSFGFAVKWMIFCGYNSHELGMVMFVLFILDQYRKCPLFIYDKSNIIKMKSERNVQLTHATLQENSQYGVVLWPKIPLKRMTHTGDMARWVRKRREPFGMRILRKQSGNRSSFCLSFIFRTIRFFHKKTVFTSNCPTHVSKSLRGMQKTGGFLKK